MGKIRRFLMSLASAAVFTVAINTVVATSRHFAYQPKLDEAVMKKYMKQ